MIKVTHEVSAYGYRFIASVAVFGITIYRGFHA